MTTYTIRALAWEKDGASSISVDTVLGGMRVCLTRYSLNDWFWQWEYWFSGHDEAQIKCASMEDGKAAAEAHYRERIEQALEVVG